MNLEKLRKEGLKDVIDAVEAVFAEAGVDFYYLIGAIARDYWFQKEGKDTRSTKDIDFAIWTSQIEQFEQIMKLLQERHGLTPIKGNAFSLNSPNGVSIDILPFGGVEVDDGVKVSGVGLQNIKVNGFKEVAEVGTEEVEIDNYKFKVATLPAIVLLKLIAYDDRPDQRGKDPGDIAHILRVYYDIEDNFIFDNHFDLLERIEDGHDVLAARVIGREMKKILQENAKLAARVIDILIRHQENEKGNTFIDLMAKSTTSSIGHNIVLIKELQEGIND